MRVRYRNSKTAGMSAPELAAWLKGRLSGAQDDWRTLLAAMVRHAAAQPVERVVDKSQIRALADAHLQSRRVEDLVRIAFAAGVRPAVREGRGDGEPIGRWMPEDAQTRLAALAAQEGLIDPRWVEELFKQDAAEELLAETLYQSLKDFSTLVPRVLQKVLPSGLGRLAGMAATAGGKVFDEVERVLDGEIRRFLEKGTRKALDRAAAFANQNLDGPTALEGRRNMVRFALEQSGQFHVDRLSDARIDELEAIALATATHIAQRDELKTRLDDAVDRIWQAYHAQTIGEVLSQWGGTADPPVDEWAAATWPVVRTALETPEVQAWIDRLADEFFAQA